MSVIITVSAEVYVFVNNNITTWKHVYFALVSYIIISSWNSSQLPTCEANDIENAQCIHVFEA